MPQVHATAQARSGDLAVIAYTVHLLAPGPLGRWHEAFLLRSADRGVTWTELPFTRTIASHVRYWGYPVWPPETVCAIKLEQKRMQIEFRDEWVPFEPGGESFWTGAMSKRGLWSVRRVREMDYDGSDTPIATPAIELDLGPGIYDPAPELVARISERVAAPQAASVVDKFWWLPSVPAGGAALLLGEHWVVLAVALLSAASLPVTAILLDRRRRRVAARAR